MNANLVRVVHGAGRSSDVDDESETLGGGSTAYCVATGAAGATTVNDRPGPSLWGTVARIVWPEGTFTSVSSGPSTLDAVAPMMSLELGGVLRGFP